MSGGESLEQQYTDAFETMVRAGAAAYRTQHGVLPNVSHITFRFSTPAAYDDYVVYASRLGQLKRQAHKGLDITWCQLDTPLRAGKLVLEWLELIHPGKAPAAITGIAAVTFYVPGLTETVKIPSPNPDVTFRYLGQGATELMAE